MSGGAERCGSASWRDHQKRSPSTRTCLGNHFAIAEGQVLLATLARRFDLDLATRDGIEITRFPGSLRPDRPVVVRLRTR